ncbi:ROK family protein [Treponema primitia]|uniref:ROK family protein n=1 Tax=Treponema primitia TaxID=88058 RepID=UPI000255581C|nr:ROK family protein [Treponema primitia]
MDLHTIGIDVGGTKAAYGLLNGQKEIIRRRSHPSDDTASPEEFFDTIVANIKDLMAAEGLKKEDIRGIGIGMPSFVLFEEGRIIKTTNLTKIHDFPARTYLMEKLGGIRVLIDNDSHTGAIAEHRQGAGRGFENMIYCPISTGISSGIIIDGKLFRGRYGWSGESGHMIVTPDDGVECGCGNRGCLMSWSSGSMIIKHIEKWIEQGEQSIMPQLAGGGKITAFHLGSAYNAGDALAHRAYDQMVKYLGIWIYNLYVTLNINCFVFGGGLLKLSQQLMDGGKKTAILEDMKEVFDGYNKNDMPVYFKEAELGNDFGIIGAAELLF